MGRFGGISKEFSNYSTSRIAVLPIPFDRTSSWIKGSSKGPSAVIKASANMEMYDIATGTNVAERGIYTSPPVVAKTPGELVDRTYKLAKGLLDDGKFVVGLGGEHSVSVGLVKAHAEKFSELSVLQLDAHLDLRDEYMGSKLNHACVMARVNELVDNIVQVGIRSADEEEVEAADLSRVFLARDIIGRKNWYGDALGFLSKKVYVTIDLDVFDPSLIPSVGTPEPGGLGWYDVMGFLSELARKKRIVGFEVVELCPIKGLHAPDFTTAKLIYSLLSYVFGK